MKAFDCAKNNVQIEDIKNIRENVQAWQSRKVYSESRLQDVKEVSKTTRMQIRHPRQTLVNIDMKVYASAIRK